MSMKKNKVHTIIEQGIVYIGVYMNRRKQGKGKVGTTENELKSRVSNIRSTKGKDFRVIACFVLPDTTKSCIEHIESGIKIVLEKNYTHVGNDHFTFRMDNRKEGYVQFVKTALLEGIRICEEKHWNYELRFFKTF